MVTSLETWSNNVCSSVYDGVNNPAARCSNALDGNTGTDWVSNGAQDGGPTISFQLSSQNAPAVTLLGIMWYTRNTVAACERITSMRVIIDNGNFNTAPTITATDASACAAPGWLTAYLPTPLSTRSVWLAPTLNCAGGFTPGSTTTQSPTCNAGFAEVKFIISA